MNLQPCRVCCSGWEHRVGAGCAGRGDAGSLLCPRSQPDGGPCEEADQPCNGNPAPTGRLLPAAKGKDNARRRPRQVPSPGKDLPFPGTLALSPAAVSDTAEGTVWLVTGDPQPPAALSRAMQNQSKKINEVLHCPLALRERHEEEAGTLPEPCTEVSGSPWGQARAPQPGPFQALWDANPVGQRVAVPAPCRRAGPGPQPQTRQKVIIPRNCRAGENKSRKDVKGGEDA